MAEAQTQNLVDANAKPSSAKYSVKRKTVILVIVFVLGAISALVIGIVIGMARITSKMDRIMKTRATKIQGKSTTRMAALESILKRMEASKLREDLRYLSLKPHTAGMTRNNELGEDIHRRFKSYGFKSEKASYNVLLSYPRKDKPNYAHIIDENGKANFTTQKMEKFLEPGERAKDVVQPFNAYSPAKTVQGDLVYVNYGRRNDFKQLKEKYNISCKGKIVLLRYGMIFRGDQVKNAESHGAIGVLLYNDPKESGPVPDSQLFPNGKWLPRDGVQRGSIGPFNGDPLTKGYPSTDEAYRVDPKSKEAYLPTIPCHPISAQDAAQFLSKLGGMEVKDKDWRGALNLTYRTGPGFMPKYQKMSVKIEIHNERKQMKITNIIGTLKGSVEPDRYILVGGHRDAWVFGAVDPLGGTVVMMEIARAMGQQLKKGWRPRRSIVFCSWDGEEQNIIGSSEWVEQHVKLLQDRAVAYINLDGAVFGNYSVNAGASPLFYKTILDATNKTMDPTSNLTALQKYKTSFPSKTRPNFPAIRGLGSGSDHLMFYQLIGVPSLDLSFVSNKGFYPVYHSLHDTFYWITKFADPTFKVHLAVSHIIARCILLVADSPLIPWNVKDYAIELKNGAKNLKKLLQENGGSKHGANTDYLDSAIEKFEKEATAFNERLKSKDMSSALTLRMINDRLMQLEKGFILPEGLPGRPYVKHLVYAPSAHNAYASTLFSGVADQLLDIKKNPEKWETVKRQLTILATRIESVTETLKDDM